MSRNKKAASVNTLRGKFDAGPERCFDLSREFRMTRIKVCELRIDYSDFEIYSESNSMRTFVWTECFLIIIHHRVVIIVHIVYQLNYISYYCQIIIHIQFKTLICNEQ